MVKEKGLDGYLQDDPNLITKAALKEECMSTENKDHSLEEAYREYCSMIEKG